MAKRLKRRQATDSGSSAKASAKSDIGQGLPTWLSHDWVWGLILLLAVILIYQPVWYAGFIRDDDILITTHLRFLQISFPAISAVQ